MRVRRMADTPIRHVSDACLWCYYQMDLLGQLPEDIALNFGLRPCALPYTRDNEHLELEKLYSCVESSTLALSANSTGIHSYCIP